MTNPELLRTAGHEAAHAVANYVLGLPIRNVQVWEAGEGVVHPMSKPSQDVFATVVSVLCGGEYARSTGFQPHDDNDFRMATRICDVQFGNRAAARAGFNVALESAHALVRTERFRDLVAVLAPWLAEHGWNSGGNVRRFLRENDPDRDRQSDRSTRKRLGDPRGVCPGAPCLCGFCP